MALKEMLIKTIMRFFSRYSYLLLSGAAEVNEENRSKEENLNIKNNLKFEEEHHL